LQVQEVIAGVDLIAEYGANSPIILGVTPQQFIQNSDSFTPNGTQFHFTLKAKANGTVTLTGNESFTWLVLATLSKLV